MFKKVPAWVQIPTLSLISVVTCESLNKLLNVSGSRLPFEEWGSQWYVSHGVVSKGDLCFQDF